jgi:hypothetical protein
MADMRSAQPGDLCILISPGEEERLLLRKEQDILAKFYSGWIVPEPHVTVQRFRMESGRSLSTILNQIQIRFQKVTPFTVYAVGLTQFLAPFWGTYVLRWLLLEDHSLRQFFATLDGTLTSLGCQVDYAHEIPATCGAVDLTHEVNLEEGPDLKFPRPLFIVQKVTLTGIVGVNEFETLGEIHLTGVPA